MELTEIRDLVLSADPQAKHYEHSLDGGPYTTWRELSELPAASDDEYEPGWRFVVEHFTDVEFSEVAKAIRDALAKDERVAYRYDVDYEQETGIIRHAFTCEGL